MNKFDASVGTLGGIGKKRLELYNKVGISTLEDLIYYFPRKYHDYSLTVPIADLPPEETCVISAFVTHKMPMQRLRGNLQIYKLTASDGTSDITITFYNNPYTFDKLMVGEEYIFCGKVKGNGIRKEMNTPIVLDRNEPCRIRPVYKLTEGLTAAMVQNNMMTVLSLVDDKYPDMMPDGIRKAFSLCTLGYALHNIHFPESDHGLELARTRLCFDELTQLRLGMMQLKSRNRSTTPYKMTPSEPDEYYSSLPFEPTNAQKKAISQIIGDMCGDSPMNRLVQGDVGSGKTAVAAAACWFAVKNNAQAALMAPTEILAKQHFATLKSFLEPLGITVECLTGSMSAKHKNEIKARLQSGEINVITGTHALISESVEFASLGLVITDEQHRFGVNQRKSFAEKGNSPHKLVMSATPIPRTLGLIIYGDLDISILDELPKGRMPVETFPVSSNRRKRSLEFIRKKLDEGRQAYIVCPMVEETDKIEAQAVTAYKKQIETEDFAGYSVGLLHGQMHAAEKDAVMESFKNGEIQLLVCTTVVEVGVDVPNSTVMMIENAERFGLSQLHQLRGRVGRGSYQSYCILICDCMNDEDVRKRMEIMQRSNDGFRIAEEDMKLRGMGDFFGERQHGLPPLKIASVSGDPSLIQATEQAASDIYSQSPTLEKFPLLKAKVDAMFAPDSENSMN